MPGFKPHRNGVRIIGAIIDEAIDLTNAQIPCELWLSNCEFLNSVSFLYASVVGGVSFEDSVFKADANFARIKVVSDAFFNGTVFEGPVKFIGADIAEAFNADEAQFKDKENRASFNSMRVGQTASFSEAVFEGR